jgi:hypothetical protein
MSTTREREHWVRYNHPDAVEHGPFTDEEREEMEGTARGARFWRTSSK